MLNNYKSKKLNLCRICKGKNLINILDFGNTPLGNDLQRNKRKKVLTFKLSLNRCKNCKHFQLSHSVNPKLLYAKNYTYLSGISDSFLKHFQDYSKWIINKIKLKKNDLVVDVGSNDGSCLSFFKRNGCRVIGVDPASEPVKIAMQNKILSYNNFFNKNIVNKIIRKEGYASLITSHNVFAHIEDFDEVIKSAYILLKEKGFLCFEVGYVENVIKNNHFDTIYHEHLDYHQASPIKFFLNKFGFSVISFYFNKIQGGSIRVLAKKDNKIKNSVYVERYCKEEGLSKYMSNKNLKTWQYNINIFITNLRKDIHKYKKLGYIIAAYGAPTKASLILKLIGDSKKYIQFCIDDNKLKQDK